MNFVELLDVVRRRWRTVAVTILLALIVGAALSAATTREYASQSRVFISNDSSSTQDAYAGSLFSSARVQSYADLANSRQVMDRVISKLKLDQSPDSLSQQVTAVVPEQTVIITIEARDTSAKAAQAIAQAVADELSNYIEQVETPNGKPVAPVKATVIDPASFNAAPVQPRTPLNLAIALAIGVFVGLALAFGRDLTDTSIKSEGEVAEITSAPQLGAFARDVSVPSAPLIRAAESHSPAPSSSGYCAPTYSSSISGETRTLSWSPAPCPVKARRPRPPTLR